jgi:acyl dehydratase
MWNRTIGLYCDEMSVGDVYEYPIAKTITETDALLFSAITSAVYYPGIAERTGAENANAKAVDIGVMAIIIAVGIGVDRLTFSTTIEDFGMSDVRLLRIIAIGDTVRAESEILDKRESTPYANAAIIEFETRAYNQRNEVLAKFRCLRMIKKK